MRNMRIFGACMLIWLSTVPVHAQGSAGSSSTDAIDQTEAFRSPRSSWEVWLREGQLDVIPPTYRPQSLELRRPSAPPSSRKPASRSRADKAGRSFAESKSKSNENVRPNGVDQVQH
jgi:hypothetical protein